MKVIATDKAPGAIGPYSQGFIVNGFVFTSGQIPVDPATGEAPEGIEYREVHESSEEREALYAEMSRISALSDEEVWAEAQRIVMDEGKPLPTWGKTALYDGKTGEPFEQPVTVGLMTEV